nr:MAG TPA: AAA domain protein [Caudoviricetes sp.]
MADGNVGNLWMSLGLKETVSKELNKIADGMTGVDAKTRKAQENLRKLADTDVSGKNISFLKKIQNALGDTSAEAKELQAVLGVIGKTKGGWKGITEDLNIGKLQQCAKLVQQLEFALTNIESKKGLSDSGFNLQSTIYQSREAIDAIASLQNHLKFADAPTASGLKAIRQELQGLINEGTSLIQSPIKNYTQIDKWLNTLDGKVTDIEYKYIVATQGVSKETNAVADAGKRAEEQTKKNAEAVNEQTNALKKQEEQLKATSAAQKEKSAAESKAATAPKIQPFVEDKGLDKMLNYVTAAREKDAAATQAQISYQLKLDEALDAFKGKASAVLGVKDDSGRKYVDILNEANAAIEKINRARAKAMKEEGKDFNPANYPDPTPRIKKALEYLSLLQRIDIAQKHISEVKAANPNVDTKNIKEAARLVENFRDKLLALQNDKYLTGADDAHILGAYRKTLAMTLKDVDAIIGKLQKPNPLSDLDGNFSKLDARIDAVREKLAKLRDLMNEGTQKGYNTSMFGERISGLGGIVTRMEAAMSNKNGELANVDKMKQLFSDISVELNKASTAMQTYGREKAKAVATDRNLETMEARYRRLQELISEVNRKIRELNDSARQGFKVGADTSRAEIAISRLTEMRDKFNNADIGSKNAVAELVSEYKILKNEIGNAKSEQDKLNNAITRANKKQDRKNERQEARDNKQRLSEIKATEARYDSLGNKVRALRREFSRGISLGADVSKAEAEIHRLINIMRYLKIMHRELKAGSMSDVGRIGSVGTGHDTTLAGRALQDQKATNAAAQEAINKGIRRGIDLERERQQEIAKSAAKVRSDLAAALAGANAEASKMHGTLNDIKSLFLQGGIVYGAQSLFNAIVQTGGEIVQQHIALRSILGDVTKADELFAQTQELALRSPFKFGELNRDVKQLAAFGVEADSLYDTTKRLADIASGLGVSFERLGLAYGQVKARSWLDGKELRQFAYAGLPLLQKITELYNSEGKNNKTNYKQSDVKEMISKRQVSFEDVQKVLWKMTDEGGQFYNMQLVLSETLLGQWNKLKDAWEIMLSRFAEGKNVIGGTFMFAIKGATDLLLTIDKLSPALLTFASVFLSKKLFGLASSRLGIGSIGRNLNDQAKIQLRNYAIEQQQLVLERKITQEIATQNVQKRAYWLADVQTQQAVMGRLALEGKLSILQMQKAVREGLITKELIDQLVIMGQITARQGEIILKGGTMAAVMNMTGSKLKGMLSFVGGWVGLTFMAVTQVISSIYNEFSAIKEKAESLQAPDSDWMKDYYDALGAKKGTTDTELKKQIDSMKQLLIKSDAYTKTIDEQIKKAKDLNEQYDILREGVENAKNVASGDAGMIADAIGSTGGWKSGNPFNDTIEENLKDLQHSTDAYQLKLSAFDEATKSKMDSVASAILGAAGAGKTLEDKIRILADEGGQKWAVFQANMVKWNKNIGFSIKVLGNKANDVTSDINEIANDDVPRILNTIKKHLGLYGNDFKNWCKQNPERFRNMLLQIMDEAKWLIPQINKELEKITSFKFEPSGNKNSVTGKTVMQERVFENLRGNQKAYDLISSYIAEGSWYKTKNNAQSALQDLYNEMKSRQKGGASKASIAEAKKDYETLHKAVLQGFGYNFIPEDKKSNKVPKNKGDKKDDKELDELKRQLEDFKAARQAYQKLRKEAGMSRAKAKNEVFGLYKDLDWKKIDLDNYSGSIARLKDGFNFDKTNDRKKFRTQLDKENFEWRFSEELKPEWERVASNFKEALEKGVKQANLQKELYEKTGSLDFAKLAFQDGAVWDKQTRKMAEDFKKNFGHDVNLGMTEADAKVLYKDTPLALEAWQKITTLVKDNYVKSLQQAADIIAQTASTQEKIAAIYAKYETPIAQAKEAGDNGLAYRYTRQRDKEVNSAKTEAFNKSSDYITFFGAVSQLGMDRASEIASQIRENINQALADGTIDAREYGKQIQQLDEQLNKLSSGKKNFFNAGLSGVAEQRVQNANEKITAGAALKQEGERLAQEATTRLLDALKNSDWDGVAKATAEVQEGKKKAKEGENKIKEGQEEAKAANKFKKAMSAVSVAADKINANIQGVVAAFNDIKDTASALGVDTESNAWQDATAFFDSLNGISNSISSIATSAMSGNVGGVIQGVVGIFTSPFKAFAAAHDAKQERQIKLAERNITELERLRNDVKTAIENTLGGVYSYKMDKDTKATLKKVTDNYEKGLKLQESGVLIGYNGPYTSDTYNAAKKSLAEPDNAFLAEQASLMAQKDEMQRQLNAEQGKKKKDKDKIADYKQEIKEMETTIKQLATDFLKDIYGVDMKAWASQLTDAVVSAWGKGEDAIDAYKKKARDMVKDLTKNILSQKIMEKALEGPLEALTTTIEQKGRLEPEDVVNVADELYKQTDDAVYNITAILESLKDRGLDLSATGDGSVTNGIKNITEETADILASYVNAIRLDVSVNRAQVKDIGELLKMRLPEMGQIQKAQLGQLTQIVMLAEARNEKLDRMMDWMNAVSTSGRKKLYIS